MCHTLDEQLQEPLEQARQALGLGPALDRQAV